MARPESSSLSRTFALVLASVVLLLTFLVAPLWNGAGAPSSGLRESRTRIRASRALTDAYIETLCRSPYDTETVRWDSRPFEKSELIATLSSTAEGEIVRETRSLHFEVLRRVPTNEDCVAVRDWVDRGFDIEDMTRRFTASPEARRVAKVREIFVETFGRDPRGWDDSSLRRWVDSVFTLAEIKSRLGAQRPMVGVHYFTWYRSDQGSWGNNLTGIPADAPKPAIGWYASDDPAVIETHVTQMAGVGLDFVIVHVIAQLPASWDNARTFFRRLAGRKLNAAVMLDGLSDETAAVQAQWVEEAKGEFAGHANYFNFHGQPLIMLFSGRLDFAVPGVLLRNVYWTDRYDPGSNTFNVGLRLHPRDWPFWSASPQPLVNGVVPVVPGYVDSHLGRPRSMEHPRENGQMYDDQWRRALELHPELIIIYSWNEYFERTAIEPTEAWGDQYLQQTACYIEHAHRGTVGGC